jgi:CO/xanthine dehydrogenase Mo-binding subunit
VLENAVETEATAQKVVAALGEPSQARHPYEKIGQGIASCMSSYGRMCFLHDTSRSYVSVDLDGSATVRCGVQDLGGGQASSLAQITAEALGIPMEQVTVFHGDSALTPLAGTTTATRQLYMSGNATLKAAATVRRNLLKKAGDMLNIDPAFLDIKDSEVFIQPERKPWMVVENENLECTISYGGDRGDLIISEICGTNDPDTVLPLTDVIRAAAADGVELFCVAQFNAPARELIDFKTGQGQVWPDLTFGTIGMEVAVDTETGMIEVLKIVSCFDLGQAINPLSAEGQMEGGAVYGLGYGWMEDVVSEQGAIKTPTLAEYLLPTSEDVPPVETIMIQSGGGIGPFGAKGIGEPATVPAAPAFANAVAAAIGSRVFALPLTPDKILKALGKI